MAFILLPLTFIITLLSVFDAVDVLAGLFIISGEFMLISPSVDSMPDTLIVLLFSSDTLVALLRKSLIALPSPPPTIPSNSVVRLSRPLFSRVVILPWSVEVCEVNVPIVVSVAAVVACKFDMAVALLLLLHAASTNSANASATPT